MVCVYVRLTRPIGSVVEEIDGRVMLPDEDDEPEEELDEELELEDKVESGGSTRAIS